MSQAQQEQPNERGAVSEGPNVPVSEGAKVRRGWLRRMRRGKPVEPARAQGPMDDVATWEDWREYFDLVSWLVPDVYRHAPARVVGIVALSIIGVSARAGMLGSLLLYVNARTSGEPLMWLGLTLPTEATLPVFLLWGSITMGFAAITISVSYRADVFIFDVAQSYMEMAIRRVLRHEAAGREIDLPDDLETTSSKPIALMLRGDTYRLVRVVIQTLGILLPLITLAAASAVLLATNWMLTAFLTPIIVLYSVGLGYLNRGVMRDSQKRQFARQRLTRDVNAMLRTLDGTRYPAGGEPEWLRSYPRRSWMQEAMGAFRGIILAKKRVDYLADAFQGAALLLVLMAFGTLVATQGTSWAVLLTYLLGLGYATRSMGRASKCVTAANRFIPQVRRYVLFMQNHEPVKRRKLQDTARPGVFQFEAMPPLLPESRETVEVGPGQVFTCVPAGTLKSSGLGELCFALAGGDPVTAYAIEAETFFLRGTAPLPERALWRYLPKKESRRDGILKRVRHFLEGLGVGEEFDEQLGDLDTVLTSELDEQLSPMLRYALRLLPGVVASPHLFVLDREPLEKLGPEGRERVLATLADRVVLLVPRSPLDAGAHSTHGVLVLEGDAIRGIGDAEWYTRLDRRTGDPESPNNSDPGWSDSDDADDLDDMEEED